VTPKIEGKRVKLLQAAWNDGFLDQVSMFPMARHDGIVDALVYAIGKLLNGTGSIRWYM
jgi:phage terminase large subunit-like protein